MSKQAERFPITGGTSAPHPVTRSTKDGPISGEFGRMTDLLGKLMHVPKSEVDEKRKG